MSYDPQPGDVPSYPQRPQGGTPQGGPAQVYPQGGDDQGGYGQGGAQQGWGAPMGGPRSGPSLFPFPSWTTRTRGGSTVTVGGCCLPLPIGCLATTLAVGAVAGSRVVRHLRG
ncbi:hypothetical protein [Arsenicicoccus dermatophilus]|uniref:hypothetical protein n=1 Tax=Arsenicicoccus dermatophilus TaxID=1076331 RepID=UPI0039172A2A